MNIMTPSDNFIVSELEWPTGAPDSLPTEVTLSIPYYITEDPDDNTLEDYIIGTIHEMSGVCPLDTFSFEPVD